MKKKKKKKIVIKKLIILIFFASLIGMIAFININNNNEEKRSEAMEALNTYMCYINDGKYEEMYNMLSNESKKDITKEDFVSLNKTVYEQIEASHILLSNMEEEEEVRKN